MNLGLLFFSWVLQASFAGTILVGMIMLVKGLLKDRLGGRWHYGLWLILVIKLTVPYTPASSINMWSLWNYVRNTASTPIENRIEEEKQSKNFFTKEVQEEEIKDYGLSVNRDYMGRPMKVLFCIWILGIGIQLFYLFMNEMLFYHKMKDQRTIQEVELSYLWEGCKATMKVKADIELIETNSVQTPALLGVFRVKLLLPPKIYKTVSIKDLQHIMFHELGHYKRKDIWIGWIVAVLQILHWFNPIIRYAFHKMGQDREIACDAFVLSKVGAEKYKEYGASMIRVLEIVCGSDSALFMAGLSGNRKSIQERVRMIAIFRKESLVETFWKGGLILLIASLILTGPKEADGSVLYTADIPSSEKVVYENLEQYFQGYEGTFVLFNRNRQEYRIFQEAQSRTRVSPNSTFKIMSALIGLETGILEDEKAEREWDGTEYPFAEWNQDQDLISAIKYSVNWYFESVHQQVGQPKMQQYLKEISYGNEDMSGGIQEFWIQSSLKIAPIEQVQLLMNVYAYKVPFSREHVDIVKKALLIRENNGIQLSGKTGSGVINNKKVSGWFVGYLEEEKNVYFFATYIQGQDLADGAAAREITMEILKDKKILNGDL